VIEELKAIGVKARRQIVKDYVAFPALAALAAFASSRGSLRPGRRAFKSTLAANFTANIVRNVWAYSIIFCGHFPDQTYTFSQEEVADETRGGFYVRQLLGAANIDGGPLFHLLAGNLSFQVEHHLYPDMPSSRYAEIAPRVRDICRRYGLPYNTGPLHKQLGTVHRTILRLAFPGGNVRAKPGAYDPS
jgi:linoleoyl-CoA desaturase